MILEFIWLVILFGIFWVLGAIGHELFHGIACAIQGYRFRIEIWWFNLTKKIKLPSMRTIPVEMESLPNEDLFYYLGGIGLGGTFTLVSLIFYFIYAPLFIVLFIIGVMHFFYGIYEGSYIRKLSLNEYMKYHYILYSIGFIIGLLLVANPMIEYIW